VSHAEPSGFDARNLLRCSIDDHRHNSNRFPPTDRASQDMQNVMKLVTQPRSAIRDSPEGHLSVLLRQHPRSFYHGSGSRRSCALYAVLSIESAHNVRPPLKRSLFPVEVVCGFAKQSANPYRQTSQRRIQHGGGRQAMPQHGRNSPRGAERQSA
jgi:hypothetical protein